MKYLKLTLLVVPLLMLLNAFGVWAIASGLPSHDGFVCQDPQCYVCEEEPCDYLLEELQVSASNGPSGFTDTQIIYMQWDLANIVHTNIETATLSLTTTGVQDTSGTMLSLHETGNNWTEDTLTTTIGWDNKPALGAVIETQPAPENENQIVIFNSSALKEYIKSQATSSEKKVSFALRFSSGTPQSMYAAFRSKEHTEGGGPYLSLQGPNAVKKSALRVAGLELQWPIVGALVLGGGISFIWRRRAVQRRRL